MESGVSSEFVASMASRHGRVLQRERGMPLQIGIGYSTTFCNPQSPLLEDEDRAGERREPHYRLESGSYYILESAVSSL